MENGIKHILNLIFYLLTFILSIFYLETYSSFFLYTILLFIIFLISSDVRYDISLLFNFGILTSIFFIWYWGEFYGSVYVFGRYSDDWQYDINWSKPYFDNYGINPLYLSDYLGVNHNSKGYVYLLVLMHYFGQAIDGYHTLLPRIVNIFFLSLISLISYKIIFIYSKNKVIASKGMYAIFLFPVILFSTAHVFRDTIITFLILSYYFSSQMLNKNILYFLWLLVILLILSTLRFYLSILLLLILPILSIYARSKIYIVLSLLVLLMPFIIFNFNALVVDALGLVGRYDNLNIKRFGNLGSKIFELPKFIGLLPRTLYLIFSPVPSVNSFYQFYLSISTFLQIIFFPILFSGMFSKSVETNIKVMFFVLFLVVALSTATFRHTLMYLPFAIIIICLYLNYRGSFFNKIYFYNLSILIILFFITMALVSL